jgi:hypothetical protein
MSGANAEVLDYKSYIKQLEDLILTKNPLNAADLEVILNTQNEIDRVLKKII